MRFVETTRPGVGSRLGTCIAAVAVAVLSACGGAGGDAGGAAGGGAGTPPPASGGALRAATGSELLDYFKAKIAERSAQGLDGTAGTPPPGVSGPVFSAAPGAISGTTVQERGVDEDDRLKSDGTMLYAMHPSRVENGVTLPATLAAARIAADGSLQDIGSVPLRDEASAMGMYLAANRLAVLAQKNNYNLLPNAATLLPVPATSTVALDVYAVAEGAKPAPQHRIEIDGWLVGSRRIGDVLYVVSSWQPDLSRYKVPANSTAAQVQQALAGLSAGALMPTVRIDGAPAQPLVTENDCFVQPANASLALQLTTITAFDLSAGGMTRSSRCFVGDGNTLYMSPRNVYIASSQQVWIATTFAATVFPRNVSTDVHKFALNGLNVEYRGSGQVAGHLGWDNEKMPYRMSEHQGDLRVVSFTGETGWTGGPVLTERMPGKTPSPATLTVLRENTSRRSLDVVGTLPNGNRTAPIGKPGEQVYAVHFAGPRAYVVTFRRVDPLYVLDLSNPSDPRMTGELTMPGYSDYLYPLAGGDWLLGVGRDASATGVATGLKFALFDVRNPAQPRLASSMSLGDSGSMSALDASRHGINLFEQGTKTRIALPVLVNERVNGTVRLGYQGLARFEADTSQGTLVERPFVMATRFDGTIDDSRKFARYPLASERSLQSTLATYYLSGGQVTTIREP